jgi:signal transduction histidine kinase
VRLGAAQGFSGAGVLTIRRGRRGLWIGTTAGLSEYRDGVFRNFGAADGLTGTLVRAVYEDPSGVVWIGTYDHGLFRLANGTFRRFTTRDGLFDNGAFQILEDASQHLWISSNSGIYRVAKKDLDEVASGRAKSVVSVPYGKRDGMITAECNGGTQPAGIRAADGRLWFPTQKGVVVIDADHIPVNRVPPPAVLTGVTIDHEPAPLGDRVDIQPGQSAFEISYAGLTFIRPELTRFRYKLEGLDPDWVDAGNRRTAYFSHVPFGSYRFVVMAANRDGVWSDRPASMAVVVVTPVWRTRWFRATAVLLIAGVAAALVRSRIRALERARAMQEEFSRQLIDSQERERKRIAAELHDSLGQSLIVIKNHALLGRSSEVSDAATAALNEVREIAYNLGPHQIDRLGLAATILDMVDRVSAASGIAIAADVEEVDALLPKTAAINLYRIVQESVNNIVKHSGATKASITLERDGGRLVLTIRDNGRGFPRDAHGYGRRPRGFGLVGLSERARLMGGTCAIESAVASGTRIAVEIPFGHPH